MIFSRVEEEERLRKENEWKVPILNEGFQHQKHPVKKDVVIPGSVTIGIFNLLMLLRMQPQ